MRARNEVLRTGAKSRLVGVKIERPEEMSRSKQWANRKVPSWIEVLSSVEAPNLEGGLVSGSPAPPSVLVTGYARSAGHPPFPLSLSLSPLCRQY